MKFFQLSFLLLLCCLDSVGQYKTSALENYSAGSASPEGSALAMYAQVPVNQSTGIPSIVHPITSLSGLTSNLDVSISYHSLGNRVDSYSTWVGLGWALNAGGVISRKVNGRPDEIAERTGPGYSDLDNGEYGDQLYGAPNGGFLAHSDDIPFEFEVSNEAHQDLARRAVHGLLDLEPDEFYFNFMGRSGMFVFNNSGVPTTVPFQNIRIEVLGEFEGFIVTDEAGYKYTFSQMEFTRTRNSCGKSEYQAFNSENCSAWYLTKVENINGQVEFEIEYEANAGPSFTYSYYETMVEFQGEDCPETDNERCEILHTQYIQHISRIFNANGYITFKKGLEREDLVQDYVLESVSTFNSDDVLLATTVFDHSYFLGLNDTKRLRLDGYYAMNSVGEQLSPVLFEYNSEPLPSYDSKAIDHWGFYNAAINYSLIPGEEYAFSGRNRETNISALKAGMLEKVISPTGAKQVFEFESNEYGYINNQEIDFDNAPNVLMKSVITSASYPSLVSLFTVTEEQTYEVHFDLIFDGQCQGTSYVQVSDGGGTVLFYESSNTSESGVISLSLLPGTYEVTASHGDCSYFEDPSNGDYTPIGSAKIEFFVDMQLGSNTKSRYGGGLRIRKMSTEDSNGQNQTSTTFFYQNFDELDRSSGIVNVEPVYSMPWIPFGQVIQVDNSILIGCQSDATYSLHQACGVKNSFSFSLFPLEMSQGGYVTYTNVTEVMNCNGVTNCENGRVEYEFSFEPNGSSSIITQHRPYSPDWKRGNLVEKRIFNADNKIVQSNEFEYSTIGANGPAIRGLKAVDFITTLYTSDEFSQGWCKVHFDMRAAVYSYQSEKYALIKKTDRVFDQSDEDKYTTTETEFQYDANLHITQTQTINLESGEATRQKVKYVTDYYPFCSNCEDGQSEALNYMALPENRAWGHPIEKLSLRKKGNDYFVIGGQLSEFDINDNGKLILKATWDLQLESPILESAFMMSGIDNNGVFIKDVNYRRVGSVISYDNALRPIVNQNESDIPNTVIRDYSDGRVVGRVQNAMPNQCVYTSFETANGNGWNYDINNCFEGSLNHLGFYFSIGYTGNRYYEFDADQIESLIMPAGSYRLTFWTINNNSLNVTASNGAVVNQNFYNLSDGHPYWQYNEFIIESANSFVVTLSSSLGTKLDELRLHPVNALMNTITYSSEGYVVATCSANNRTQRFFYDSWGRQEWVLDDSWEILSHNEYYQKNPNDPYDRSWSKNQVILTEGMTKEAVLAASLDSEDLLTTFSYLDDFGREIQNIAVGQSPMKHDIVSFKSFDSFGRQPKQYLPFVANPGNEGRYVDNPGDELLDFYLTTPKVAETTHPFSATEFEASPLSRVVRQGNVGESWQLSTNRVIQNKSLLNEMNEVLLWELQPTGASAMNGLTIQYHPANSLFKQEMQDEHGVKNWEFRNALGQLICRRSQVLMSGSGNNSYSWNNGTGRIGDDAMAFLPGQSLTWRNSDTYFIYDDFGRLAYEIPAIAILSLGNNFVFSKTTSGTNYSVFDGYMSAYNYDKRGRTIQSKKPGEDWSKYVYNVLNQVILSQTPELSNDDQTWLFQKYDLLGRPIQSGLISSTMDHSVLQVVFGNSTTSLWENKSGNAEQPYTNDVFPTTIDYLLSEIYYDDYNFNLNNFTFDLNGTPSTPQCIRTQGAVTGQKTLVLDENMNQYLYAVSYFDIKGRPVVQFSSNILGGYDKITTEYDYSGKVSQTTRQFFKESNSSGLTIVNRFEYDHAGRIVKNFQRTGSDPEVVLSKLVYNELGQVVKKHLHITEETNVGMQIIDYRYNERGWLTKINNADLVNDGDNTESWDVFGEELIYHEQDRFYSTALEMKSQYNGNIAAVKWKTNQTPELGGDELAGHCYVFRYDAMNQMTGAYYGKSADTFIDNYSYALNSWDESVSYDANGNIRSLNRRRAKDDMGSPLSNPIYMDRLNYSYIANSNKIQKITDSGQTNWIVNSRYTHFIDGSAGATDYNYDTEGRLRDDLNKGLTFDYNLLDLVKTVTNGSEAVRFIWDANGQKLAKVIGNNAIYYFNGIEFYNNVLSQVATAEGITRCPSGDIVAGDWVYDYYIKDHLGNIRAVITEENSEIITEKVTVELERRALEDNSFDNVTLTEKDRPYLYPNDPIDPYSLKVAELSASTGKVIGPSKLMSVKQGEKLDVSAKYWFTEIPGNPLSSVEDILAASVFNLGIAGEGILPTGPEAGMALLGNTSGNQYLAISNFLDNTFQNVDFSKPQAFLIYMYFDGQTMKLDLNASGAIQVGEANALGELSQLNIVAKTDGFFYTYLTNRSESKVYYDNMSIKRWAPMVRVVYDYYPFGLTWENPALPADPNAIHDYAYQDKEFQFSEFGNGSGLALYDFHARMYDPCTARWFVPDPAAQFHNPYLAMGNDPANNIDPDGKFIFTAATLIAAPFTGGASMALLPMAIGADIGMWQGGSLANGTMNPFKWDYNSGKTWSYMASGAAVGAASGGAANAIATSGMIGANTTAIFAGSMINSMGTEIYTGGRTDISASFGIASYNVDNNGWGYLGKKGNSTMANIGYGFGALAIVSDGLIGFNSDEVQLNTESSDLVGHSALTKVGETNENISLVSVGPDPGGKWIFNPFKFRKGTNSWHNYVDKSEDVWKVRVGGINLQRITNYGANLNKGVNYNLYFSSCVNHTARALTLAGAPALGIHPFILHSQMVLRSFGVRPMLFSYYFYQQ